INLGAFFSPLVCGTLAAEIDYRWGFFAAGVGMIIGIVVFESLKKKYIITADGRPVGIKPEKRTEPTVDAAGAAVKEFSMERIALWLAIYAGLWFIFMYFVGFNFVSTLIFATSIAASGFIITDPTLKKDERDRIWVIYIIAFFVIFFWSAFEQAGASLTLFADDQTDRSIFGWEMPASWFQSINPLAIIVFAPIFAILWTSLGARNREPASPVKQSIGLFLLALGYLIIAFGVKGATAAEKTSMFWLLSMYLIHTLGELCLSPIGLSMVARLAPVRLASLLMGIWFMSNAMANDFAGMLSKLYPEPMAPVAFVDSLKVKYPAEIGTIEYAHKETIRGIESVPVASLQLDNVVKDDAKRGEIKAAVAMESYPNPKKFLGMEIDNLYDFFMIFVVMAGVAAIILFFLSKRLLTMMHGVR
ncbi:MAG TPA: peptide MFS transporter, partial [Bacteroidia bacterium]|nr:peptide MFS transporter [Bacteroidia bacterium]